MYVLQRAGTRERVSARARYLFYSCLLACAPSMVRTGTSERRRARARVFRLRLRSGGAQTPSGIFFTPSESVSSALSETSASSSSSMSSVDLRDLNSPA